MARRALPILLPLLLLSFPGGVSAIGLGELHGQAVIGEGLRLTIDLVGTKSNDLTARCFRLIRPSGNDDLPWLRKATLTLGKGEPTVLEIEAPDPLREPILRFAVQISCEHEVSREYVLLASPPLGETVSAAAVPAEPITFRHSARSQRTPSTKKPSARRPASPHVEKSERPAPLPDRLLLSAGPGVGEPSLRLATALSAEPMGDDEASQAQREILHLQFRTLLALSDQADVQMDTAEKLRRMEGLLGSLRQRAGEFAGRVEQESAAGRPTGGALAPAAPLRQLPPVGPRAGDEVSGLSEWSLYGLLLGLLLGMGSWLGWRNYRERLQRRVLDEAPMRTAGPVSAPVDTAKAGEFDNQDIDFQLGHPELNAPASVDVELDGGDEILPVAGSAGPGKPTGKHDPQFSIGAATVDEHFEANPVMELADIMLSFGRVKGAAQALQEYIDKNPEEALQPWIRLMDVYRMAGMRDEFESVAHDLNQHFNVEIQQWDREQPMLNRHTIDLLLDDTDIDTDTRQPAPAPKAESLEELPRLMNAVCALWQDGDVVGYLYQLLRDNRGGQRQGFSLPVVEEILFMIELKETANRGD